MYSFEIGDIVELQSVTTDDELFGRIPGECGIYQGTDSHDPTCSLVKFLDFDRYVVNNEQIRRVKNRTVKSIFSAFNHEDEADFMDCINGFIAEKVQYGY